MYSFFCNNKHLYIKLYRNLIMGLFNKKKEKLSGGFSEMPPIPKAPSFNDSKDNASSQDLVNNSNLSENTLSDIKDEISTHSPNVNEEKESISPNVDISNEEKDIDLDNLNLFDIEDNQLPKEEEKNNFSKSQEETYEDVSFLKNNRQKIPKQTDSFYITTTQFKTMIEIIDNVKNKIKLASDTYLKLLDIKSEEDIEYENLRRDFQHVEGKLYDIDKLIFDR